MKDLSPESAVTESLIYNNNFWYFLDIKTKVLNKIYSDSSIQFAMQDTWSWGWNKRTWY